MVVNITTMQAKQVLSGNYTFTQLGFSMLITRMKGIFAKDPTSATLQRCTDEINSFLTKYSSIMEQDFNAISKL